METFKQTHIHTANALLIFYPLELCVRRARCNLKKEICAPRDEYEYIDSCCCLWCASPSHSAFLPLPPSLSSSSSSLSLSFSSPSSVRWYQFNSFLFVSTLSERKNMNARSALRMRCVIFVLRRFFSFLFQTVSVSSCAACHRHEMKTSRKTEANHVFATCI